MNGIGGGIRREPTLGAICYSPFNPTEQTLPSAQVNFGYTRGQKKGDGQYGRGSLKVGVQVTNLARCQNIFMIFDLKQDLEAIDREMDALTEAREVMANRLDVLAQVRETKVAMIAFESTEYTSHEVKPVNFFKIA